MKLELEYGHVHAIDGKILMFRKGMDADPQDSTDCLELPSRSSNVTTGDVTFDYPILRYITPTEKMGPWTTFPIHTTSATLTGQATLINPGHQKEFPIYYGLMHEMFNYIFGEFMRDNIGEISVKMMDGQEVSVPKAEINAASAYMRRFFEGRDLNSVVKALQAAKG